MRDHESAGVVQMLFQFGEELTELLLRHQAFGENSLTHIFKKIVENVAAVAARRVDVNDRINVNVEETCGAKHLMCLSSHEQVDPVFAGVGFENFQQAVPRGQRRITEECSPVRLVAGDHAAGPRQGHHLFDDALRLRDVDKDKACVNDIKR